MEKIVLLLPVVHPNFSLLAVIYVCNVQTEITITKYYSHDHGPWVTKKKNK